MKERFSHVIGWKLKWRRSSKQSRPPLVEKLEPRILLSGDSLLTMVVSDPLQDSMQQVVLYAELMDVNEQAGQQPSPGSKIHQQTDPSSRIELALCHPILTLPIDNDSRNVVDADGNSTDDFDPTPGNVNCHEISLVQTNEDLARPVREASGDPKVMDMLTVVAEAAAVDRVMMNSPGLPTEEGSMPNQNSHSVALISIVAI